MPSLTPPSLPGSAVERSSSALSAPPLHADRFSPTFPPGVHPPVRRTQTISGHVTQPLPRQVPFIQRGAALNQPSK